MKTKKKMLRILRESLLTVLESVSAGISEKETVEQSTCFVFTGGRVITFNDEVACQTDTQLDKEFNGAVRADLLLSLLRKMPEDKLKMFVSNTKIKICGKGRGLHLGLDREITLPIDMIEKPRKWNKLPPEFAEAVNVVQLCARKEDDDITKTCVHIHPNWIQACDQMHACRWSFETGIASECIVRKTAIKDIVSLGMTEISETDNWIHFKNPQNLIYSCRRYLDEFPDIEDWFEVDGDSVIFPKGLTDAVERARLLSDQNSDDKNVYLILKADKVKVEAKLDSSSMAKYYEYKNVKYKGRQLAFFVSPQILIDLIKKHNECFASDEKLRVDTGSYVYAARLGNTDESGKSESDESEYGESDDDE